MEQQQLLPSQVLASRSYATVTEALTSILTGICWNDEHVAQEKKAQLQRDRSDWGDCDGPHWLLPHLSLICENREPEFPRIPANNKDASLLMERAQVRKEFKRAKRWLRQNNDAPEQVLARVKAECQQRDYESQRLTRLQGLLWSMCAGEKISLVGKRRDAKTGEVDGTYSPINYTYFLEPVWHSSGDAHFEDGKISPSFDASGPHADEHLFYHAVWKSDARDDYVGVRIKTDDVRALERAFRRLDGGEDLAPESQSPGHVLPEENAKSGQTGTPSEKPDNAVRELPLRGHHLVSPLRKWYCDEWVAGGKAHALLRERGRPLGATPNERDDLHAARERFGDDVSRNMMRPLRQEFAPADWKRPGKRKL